ncbi:PAS domain S-box protein [Roseomonas harenae]|uniref:PAS domain S-box protein n=1 Tax=Muricoccus harenae TaxID=2692566 RepID=UPI0013312467|nr:PAS domain S-box protein [Roseomonas harenae]
MMADRTRPALLDALGVAVYTTDAEGRLDAYNEAAVSLWGWRPPLGDARWCGSWRLRLPDGTPLPHDECPMAVALKEGRPVRGVEAIAERPDGTHVPFIPYPTPLRDETGALTGAVNVLVDISGRHAAETELAGSAARLRAVFDTTPECIKLVAADGTLLQINTAGLGMIEADAAAQAEGRSVFDLIAPEHRAEWRARHDRVCRGEALHWEFDIIGLRGTRRRMETHATPLRLPGGQNAHLAITRDITARKQAEERQVLLMREVDHRAKNVLAVALSLVRLTRAEDPRRFAEAVEGRIAALAHAHSLLAEEGWQGAELRAVIQAELAPFLAAGRADLRGEQAWLSAESVQPFSMVLHELATNAAKYGALSAPGGKVMVSWNLAPASGMLDLHWVESGGPPILSPPQRRGFGSKLIEATTRSQLGGEVRLHWEASGLHCDLTLAATCLQPRSAAGTPKPEAAGQAIAPAVGRLTGRRVLLVEDELLVAMETEEALRDLGCEVLGPAATIEEALRLAQSEAGRIDAAVLDVNLAGRPSFPVADLLAGRGVPVVFATGYGDLPDGRSTGATNLLLRKPLGRGELEGALSRMLTTVPAGAARQAG